MNQPIIEQLGQHVADTQVLWNLFHQLHWKVRGAQFRSVHAVTEELYDALGDQFDALAERLLMLGGTPPANLAVCLALTQVKEGDQTRFTAGEVLALLRANLQKLVEAYRVTRQLAADSGDSTTDALLSGFIADLEKHLWLVSNEE